MFFRKCLTLFLLLSVFGCSSTRVITPEAVLNEPRYIYDEFSKNNNLEMTFYLTYPESKGLLKEDAKKRRKEYLQKFVEELAHFIYMLPQGQKLEGPKVKNNSVCFESSDLLGVPCRGRGSWAKNIIQSKDYVRNYKKVNGVSPLYRIIMEADPVDDYRKNPTNGDYTSVQYFHNPGESFKFIFNGIKDGKAKFDYLGNMGTYNSLISRSFNYPIYEKNYLDFIDKKGRVSSISDYFQYIGTDKSQKTPIISLSRGLVQLTDNYSFPETSVKKFYDLYINPIYEISEKFALNYSKKQLFKKSYLFFNGWDENYGFQRIDRNRKMYFMKNKDARKRMFGLATLAYSSFTPVRLSRTQIKVDVKIDFNLMFKTLNLIKIQDEIE